MTSPADDYADQNQPAMGPSIVKELRAAWLAGYAAGEQAERERAAKSHPAPIVDDYS